jgi:hypothetical protein
MLRPWLPPWLAALGFLVAPAPAGAEPVLARYDIRAAGFTVMQVEALLDLDGPRYFLRARIRSTGLVGFFSGGDHVSLAEGAWHGTEPVPAQFRLEGKWQGTPRQIALDYAVPGQPLLRALEPPIEPWREPVPERLRRGTMDALSAIAKLSRLVSRTGRCDTEAPVYDGRRRVDYTVRTAGQEQLPPEGGFAGAALRCAFEARVVAGIRRDHDPEEARRPLPAIAWVAEVLPGRPPLPVRIEMPTRWWGRIRVVLAGVEPVPAAAPRLAASGQEAAPQRRSGQEVAQQRR